jgi:prepilin peptidase CpaA
MVRTRRHPGRVKDGMAFSLANTLAVAASIVLAISAYWDIRYRLLPDIASGILIFLAIARWSLAADWHSLVWALAGGFGVFAATAVAFAIGWIGGGDVKLMSATSFFVGTNGLIGFLVTTAMLGGVVSVLVLMWHFGASGVRRFRNRDDGHENTRPTVPYGAAIALAGLYVIFLQCRWGVI